MAGIIELNHVSEEPGVPVRRGYWSQNHARSTEGWSKDRRCCFGGLFHLIRGPRFPISQEDALLEPLIHRDFLSGSQTIPFPLK